MTLPVVPAVVAVGVGIALWITLSILFFGDMTAGLTTDPDAGGDV